MSTDNSSGKKKIAILGGGMGAITAAWYLTDSEERRKKHDVTVYQLGWRLGGKGASGVNTKKGNRIEEHGIHYFFGFYENAFHLMRECVDEMISRKLRQPGDPLSSCFPDNGGDPIFRRLTNADKPGKATMSLMEEVRGKWKEWDFSLPHKYGLPGDRAAKKIGSLSGKKQRHHLLTEFIRWMRGRDSEDIGEFTTRHRGGYYIDGVRLGDYTPEATRGEDEGMPEFFHDLEKLDVYSGDNIKAGDIEMLYTAGGFSEDEHLLDMALKILENPEIYQKEGTHQIMRGGDNDLHLDNTADATLELLLERYGKALDRAIAEVENTRSFLGKFGDRIRRSILLIRFATAFALALLRSRVRTKGFDRLDQYEFVDWIQDKGEASPKLATFPIVQALYAIGYCYNPNNVSEWSMGAGTISRIILRMFLEYRGSLAWQMQAGMGDAIFAPLYLVLKARGVKFAFFHRVDELKTGTLNGKKIINEIKFQKQVRLKSGGDLTSYDPLINVKDLPCWPAEPIYDQLDDTQAADLKKLKEKHLDLESMWIPWKDEEEEYSLVHRSTATGDEKNVFDEVVLGISVAGLKTICKDLMAESPDWKNMVEKISTVEVASIQVWPTLSARDAGWAGAKPPFMLCHNRPFDTWVDFSHLIKRESLPGVKQIAYFMDVLEEIPGAPMFFENGYDKDTHSKHPETQHNRTRDIFINKFLRAHCKRCWPNMLNWRGFKWKHLYAGQRDSGIQRAYWQYYRLNHNPSDRYVLWRPGTTQYRMKPGESGYTNLALAGDWTLNGLNAGSIEAATMSGMQASRAICQHPQIVIGEDY